MKKLKEKIQEMLSQLLQIFLFYNKKKKIIPKKQTATFTILNGSKKFIIVKRKIKKKRP